MKPNYLCYAFVYDCKRATPQLIAVSHGMGSLCSHLVEKSGNEDLFANCVEEYDSEDLITGLGSGIVAEPDIYSISQSDAESLCYNMECLCEPYLCTFESKNACDDIVSFVEAIRTAFA